MTVRGRPHAQCPQCLSLERHRLQFTILDKVFAERDTKKMTALHFAPEECLRIHMSVMFESYQTADLYKKNVDHQVDLQCLPFADETYDFVFASHVLEHVKDDVKALSEIKRILRPNGIAVLPVPIVGSITIEYAEPDPNQDYHVRAPGIDYYDRYKTIFSSIVIASSFDADPSIQPFIYSKDEYVVSDEEWVHPYWIEGCKFIDEIPICYR
ncbi:class I SAM-dependent methyltransferase [Aeromonas sp. DNP9]|uniref:class I SAM-dependent methyltransferase n=1 Tax=Aeromonas sp. DNP9 TaxID=1535548 RepID=UPI0009F32133|nr:class I SAM-dependent methyltransferase [Aeromonas sp. DNP9]